MEKTVFTPEYGVLLDVLKRTRRKAGVTQVELAEKLGESQSFVSKIERGARRLDVMELRLICQLLGMTLLEFVNELEKDLADGKKRRRSS